MHIPDGYLSPTTCAALFASVAPFWYTAAKKVNRMLHTRLVPLLSLFGAFSFVLMMFNIPLPGGTTGHATGVGIAAVVVGPWAGMLALSVALTIQAVFFGDGGITAIGANCFNIAVLGCLSSHAVYRVLSGSSPLSAQRRIVAAAAGGYVGINVAAMVTAIQFGIQPELFRDASGAPLYAPYPLKIAMPAMMLGHLTVAGFAELFVTASVVAFIQRTDPSLLELTGSGALFDAAATRISRDGAFRSTRMLWITLGLLMVLTPLGILAVGTAWGEWAPSDFAEAGTRKEIASASMGHAAPEKAPEGLARLAETWTAPIPDYAPPFLKSQALGYALSAMFGVGLTLVAFQGLAWVVSRGRQ
jgi:cobalt/nickel transport system permease protein